MKSITLFLIAHLICAVPPATAWADDAEQAAPAPPGQRREIDVAFTAELDGSEQRYIVVLPPDSGVPPRDAVFYLHGHGADRRQLLNPDVEECRAVLDVAGERNAICVSPDYRAATSWMGPAAEADVAQIIREVRREYGVRRIILTGASMGGSSVLTFAALHPDLVDAVASMNGTANHLEYASFQDAIAESFGGAKSEIRHEYKLRSAEYWPEKLTMPIAISASGQDTVVPPQSVVRLAEVLRALGRRVLLVYRDDVGHTTHYSDARTVVEFAMDNAVESE